MSKDNSRRFIEDQNPLGAIIGGIIGIPVASIIWALVISIYKLNINILAIAVGFIVGYFVRTLGKGLSPIYGIIGVIFTIIGCIFGRLLSILVLDFRNNLTSIMSQIIDLDLYTATYLLESTFKTTDLIFYFIALIIGYYTSFRK